MQSDYVPTLELKMLRLFPSRLLRHGLVTSRKNSWSTLVSFSPSLITSLHTPFIPIRSIGSVSHASVEKAMAPHSSTLAWKIPWTEEPGRLQSIGSQRVGHNWTNSLSLFTFMHWRRKWQPTPVFLPGESPGLGSLVGCCLWGRTELDTTEAT